MCRSKELGGRRCPQHADPAKHAAYNARRRELYAARKQDHQKAKITSDINLFTSDIVEIPTESVFRDKFAAEAKEYLSLISPAKAVKEAMTEERKNQARDEWEALHLYTDFQYHDIREYLNGNEPGSPNLSMRIANLDNAIRRAPEPVTPRVVYRGMTLPKAVKKGEESDYLTKQFPVGEVITQKNFMSTSLDPGAAGSFVNTNSNKAEGVLIQIVTKKGAPVGAGISVQSNYEMEILVPRKAKFRVVEVIDDANLGNLSHIYKRNVNNLVRLIDVSDEEEAD